MSSNALLNAAIAYLGMLPQMGVMVHGGSDSLSEVNSILTRSCRFYINFDFNVLLDSEREKRAKEIADIVGTDTIAVVSVHNIELLEEQAINAIISAINSGAKIIVVSSHCNGTETTTPLLRKCVYIPY